MGSFLLDQKRVINENIFKHEERMSSQYTRFLDKNPTYVTYYALNNIESTVDNGFQNIERVLGANSPLKFKKITDFPLYGIDQILLQLSDEEQGLDTSYEGEATILPNTIKPLPNEFFSIQYLEKEYLFMVTEVAYDTIKSNNFYKITFTLKTLDPSSLTNLENQTNEKYNCIMTNIGTKEKCLIREDDYERLVALNAIYSNIAEHYKILFYDAKYNCFMFTDENKNRLYDRYMSHFINQTKIFNEKNNYDTIFVNVEEKSPTFMREYHNTIYRAVEAGKKAEIKEYNYHPGLVIDYGCIFRVYRDFTVRTLQHNSGIVPFAPAEFVTAIQSGELVETFPISWQTMINHFNGKITTVYELDYAKLEDYNAYLDYTFETFILTPILLYILRFQYDKFMTAN